MQFVELGVVALVCLIAARLGAMAVTRIVHDNSSQYKMRKAISWAAYVITALSAVLIFGHNLAGLGLSLGVVGAGVAFALQEVITSGAGWVAITFGNFYHSGDRVEVGGVTGDVIDVGILRTTIMETGGWVKGDLYNGRIVRVANSFVFKQPVYNYSGEFPYLWDEITVPIRFGSDHKLARELLTKACEETVSELSDEFRAKWERLRSGYRLEDARLDPIISLVVTDNWLQYTLRYMVDYKFRRLTKDQLFERILDEIEAAGGKVQLASATVEITNFNPAEE